MNEIKLSVDDANFESVMTILESLKSGMIAEIQINGRSSKQKSRQYKPKVNSVIYEQESGTNDTSGKYMNPAAYKSRLKK